MCLELSMGKLAFLCRLTEELSSSSSFVMSMGYDNDEADGQLYFLSKISIISSSLTTAFRNELRRLYTKIVGRWKVYVVSQVIKENWRTTPSPGVAAYAGTATSYHLLMVQVH